MCLRHRLDLRPVQRNVSELDQAGCLTQLEDLEEKRAQRPEVLLAELIDGGEVRLVATRQHPECHVLVSGSLELPRREHANAVPV